MTLNAERLHPQVCRSIFDIADTDTPAAIYCMFVRAQISTDRKINNCNQQIKIKSSSSYKKGKLDRVGGETISKGRFFQSLN